MRFRYTGQQLLAPLNLYYYKARIYSPTLGRFLQTDPIGQQDDMNLYAYVGNNSINYADPTGMYAGKLGNNLIDGFKQNANYIKDTVGSVVDRGLKQGSITVQKYKEPVGPGGGVTVSWKDGTVEALGRIGVGRGVDLAYDPNGEPSKHSLKEGSGPIGRLSGSASVGVGMGVASVGISGGFMAGNGFVQKEGGGDIIKPDFDKSFGKPTKLGISSVVSIGADIGGYINLNKKK